MLAPKTQKVLRLVLRRARTLNLYYPIIHIIIIYRIKILNYVMIRVDGIYIDGRMVGKKRK